jgi:hypothetical protein
MNDITVMAINTKKFSLYYIFILILFVRTSCYFIICRLLGLQKPSIVRVGYQIGCNFTDLGITNTNVLITAACVRIFMKFNFIRSIVHLRYFYPFTCIGLVLKYDNTAFSLFLNEAASHLESIPSTYCLLWRSQNCSIKATPLNGTYDLS